MVSAVGAGEQKVKSHKWCAVFVSRKINAVSDLVDISRMTRDEFRCQSASHGQGSRKQDNDGRKC